MAQWLTLLPHSARDPCSIPASGHCLCGVCTFSPCLRGFPPDALVSSHSPRMLKEVRMEIAGGLAMMFQRTKKITAQERALQPSKPAPTMLPDLTKIRYLPGTTSLYSHPIHVFVKKPLKSHYSIRFHYLPRQRVPGTHYSV